MSTLREIVYNSVITIHRRTGKEWIPLKEIYEEVDKNREGGINNGGASVRAALETHCASSSVFSGTEEYVLKEKGSGLYKSKYYDQIKFIESINIGDIFTREQLMTIFKINGQSGIMKTNILNCLVLTTSENNGIYGDSTIENGFITYTGEGQIGDQTITKNNKTIYESNSNDLPMYLFSKNNNKNYIFEGRVKLCGTPYQVMEKDKNENERLVWKFPLMIVYENNFDFKEINEECFNEVADEIEKIENKILKGMDLECRDGKIDIIKYRKTDGKKQRQKKKDYIAEQIIKSNQGTMNEIFIYENEIKRLEIENAQDQIDKMKDFFENKNDNEGFDVLSFELDENGEYVEKYIEVKSTKGNESTPIDITAAEIDFAKKHIDHYYLYRIVNSASKDRYLKTIKGKDLFNNIDYDFIATSYKIYSK